MTVTGSDTAAITRTVDLYVEGMRNGDAAKLRERFTRTHGCSAASRARGTTSRIGELIAMVDGQPVDVDGSFQARVISVEHVGDAAFAVLEEQGFWGTVSFTDFFTLAQIDSTWRIQQDARPYRR
jgi:hypothetical protein